MQKYGALQHVKETALKSFKKAGKQQSDFFLHLKLRKN